MPYDFISVTSSDEATTIVLTRPQVLNAIHPAMHLELQDAFDRFAADRAQRICVLTGSGERAFCAGSDLKHAVDTGVQATDVAHAYPPSGYGGIARRFDLAKPVIAAVNGLALGGGFEIALACDLIIAVDDAIFGLPEPLVGAVALAGGLHRLARQIGPKNALGIILTGRRVTAQEGQALGFVNEVVPRAELRDAVGRWVRDILRCSPIAIEASKEAVYRGLGERSVSAAIERQHSYPHFVAWTESEDAREGPRAFASKRAPRWSRPN